MAVSKITSTTLCHFQSYELVKIRVIRGQKVAWTKIVNLLKYKLSGFLSKNTRNRRCRIHWL